MRDPSGPTISPFPKREATGEVPFSLTKILQLILRQGGLITGTNPVEFTTTDPLRLWIIQVCLIVFMAQLLSLGLRVCRLRQPKVIAEVLGGVLLGPTALGRIPGFTENIFPAVSLPYISLAANIGLCLYLFIVGLEINTSIVKRNARMTIIVSLAGIAIPFGLGSCISILLYHHFIDPSVHFTYFMLFTGVAYSITALPILCRILTELNLLDTSIGVVVISAGVGNDIAGWTLLALGVALVNAGSGLSAVWILLACVAFAIFLLIPVKLVMHWLARKTGSIKNGPTMFYMTVVMILVWACSFFTDSIGVNAIFGAFLAGLVVPREGGLAITLTEKLEDLVTIVFLPLFFALSGLNTNLGLLDNGITWAFTISIIVLSFSFWKVWWMHDCVTVGRLWLALIELIVLNVGLQAGILTQRVFSMFVLEALTLTFMTMPLVTVLYPPERRIRVGETAQALDGGENGQSKDTASVLSEKEPWRHRYTVVLDKLDHIPGAMILTQLLLPSRSVPSDIVSTATTVDKLQMPHVTIEALQLIELSDRSSAMMKLSAADILIHTDPMLNIFRMFGELNGLAVTTSLSVVPYDDFARSVAEHAQRHGSHLVLLQWLPSTSLAATAMDTPMGKTPKVTKSDYNPFDVLFGSISASKDESPVHSQFVRNVFSQSKTDVALFIDTGDRSGMHIGGPLHIFFPFFGGPDDRLALEFVVQLCLNPRVTATVVKMIKREGVIDEGVSLGEELTRLPAAHLDRSDGRLSPCLEGPSVVSTMVSSDTVYGQQTTQMHLQSEAADQIAWSKYASSPGPSSNTTINVSANATSAGLRRALARIRFSEARTPAPVHDAIRHARALRETFPCLLVAAGRSRRLAMESHHVEMKRLLETCRSGVGSVGLEGIRKTIGDVGTAMTVTMGGSASAVVVLQAAHAVLD